MDQGPDVGTQLSAFSERKLTCCKFSKKASSWEGLTSIGSNVRLSTIEMKCIDSVHDGNPRFG